MVIFTSFNRSQLFPAAAHFSIASWQPTGYNYDELLFLAPKGLDGKDIRSRSLLSPYFKKGAVKTREEFGRSMERFRVKLDGAYQAHSIEIIHWLAALKNNEIVCLCCWCPYSATSGAQLEELGFFACHCGLIAKIIANSRPDITILMDEDRLRFLAPPWRL